MSKHNLGALRAVVLAGAFALLIAPATALADGGGPGVTLGPIKLKHGWTATIATGCSHLSATTISYVKGPAKALLVHSYAGPRPTCRLSKSLAAGDLSVRWPGLVKIDVKLGHAGAVKHPPPAPGCKQKRAVERTLSASGTISVSIHPGVFGKISTHRLSATAGVTTGLRCTSTHNTTIDLFGTFGSSSSTSVTGIQPHRGERIVDVIDSAGDQLGNGVSGVFEAQLIGGKSVFDAAASLTTATIHGTGPVKGSLKFTAQPACAGQKDARPGTLSGRLVVDDPVLGTLTVVGSQAALAYVLKGNASFPMCGSAASPPTVSFTDGCSSPGACSVSAGTNTVYFGDGTIPGSATIAGETWDFGDGSAPLSTGYPGLNVQHTYIAPGSYTVTLTVTVAGGKQYTSTGTVYISS